MVIHYLTTKPDVVSQSDQAAAAAAAAVLLHGQLQLQPLQQQNSSCEVEADLLSLDSEWWSV